jgi:hypothetical protein
MAIRVVGVAIRGGQELIALLQYRHIATKITTEQEAHDAGF